MRVNVYLNDFYWSYIIFFIELYLNVHCSLRRELWFFVPWLTNHMQSMQWIVTLDSLLRNSYAAVTQPAVLHADRVLSLRRVWRRKNPLNTSTQWLRIVNGHIFAKAKNLRNYRCLFKMEIFDQIRKGSDSRDTFPRLIYRFLKTKISRSTSNYKLFWTLFGSVWKNLDSAPI